MFKQDARNFNINKTEGDGRVPEYRECMETAIETYQIHDHAFRHDPKIVINSAVRLLHGYDMDVDFATHPERSLFALAIADTWLSTSSAKDKKAVLSVLKLISIGKKADQGYRTLSGHVQVMSQQGLSRGTMYDPEATRGNSNIAYHIMVEKYITDNTDEYRTTAVTNTLNNWSENSKLSHVRKKLGINSKKDEHPFKSIVLNKTEMQMTEDVGFSALHIYNPIESILVFNRDYQELDSLEHEYAHSQSVGISCGYGHLLFRGLNEALTENTTSFPISYPRQRGFLRQLLKNHPEYEDILYKAYVGKNQARIKLFSDIVRDYGLIGFLTVARVSPIDNPKMTGNIGETVYIDPSHALKILREQARS